MSSHSTIWWHHVTSKNRRFDCTIENIGLFSKRDKLIETFPQNGVSCGIQSYKLNRQHMKNSLQSSKVLKEILWIRDALILAYIYTPQDLRTMYFNSLGGYHCSGTSLVGTQKLIRDSSAPIFCYCFCSFRGQVHEHLQGVPLRRIWLSKTRAYGCVPLQEDAPSSQSLSSQSLRSDVWALTFCMLLSQCSLYWIHVSKYLFTLNHLVLKGGVAHLWLSWFCSALCLDVKRISASHPINANRVLYDITTSFLVAAHESGFLEPRCIEEPYFK